MASQCAVHELHEAARADWVAAKAALCSRRAEILEHTRRNLEAGGDPDREVLPELFRDLAAERIADASVGFIVTRAGQAMMLGFVDGFPAEMIRRYLKLQFGQGICGTVAQTRRAMHVTNIQRSLDPLADVVRPSGISAYACEPLIVRNRLLGTLSFGTRTRSRFDQEDIDLFHALAAHVAIARDRIERALEQEQDPLAAARAA